MANQPPRSGSKDKDDDSWGKLASDLFGIQFGGASDDDDFDLTEDEPATAAPVPPAPTGLAAVEPISAVPGDEPDLSFPEDDDEVVVAPVRRTERPAPAPAQTPVAKAKIEEPVDDEPEVAKDRTDKRDDSEKDIWDLLESWNWDEPNRESSRSRSADDSQSSMPRSSSGRPGGRRDDRGPRRERTRDQGGDRGSDRPPRPRESEAAAPAPQESEARESRPPRREERPRRAESADRDRQRSERPPAEPRPARSEQGERRPPRSADRPAPTRSDDEFASGLDESTVARKQPVPERGRPTTPPRRKPLPPAREVLDEFDGDLFEDAEIDEASIDAEPAESAEADGESTSGEPRRRRRRRRRGGRSRRDETVRDSDSVESPADADESAESVDDEFVPELTSEAAADESEADQEARRPRRRRRRVRRRSEEATPPVEVEADEIADSSDSVEMELDDDEPLEQAGFEEDDDEIPVPVSYEGIPSWEEAISYLQRRPRDPRQRGEGAPRGRGGPHRR